MTLCSPSYAAVFSDFAPPAMALAIARYARGKPKAITGPLHLDPVWLTPVHTCGMPTCDCAPVALRVEHEHVCMVVTTAKVYDTPPSGFSEYGYLSPRATSCFFTFQAWSRAVVMHLYDVHVQPGSESLACRWETPENDPRARALLGLFQALPKND